MTPGISYRLPRNPGWSRFFVTTLFATAYYAAISNIAAVAGQSKTALLKLLIQVFPKGSPLVEDISGAAVKVVEGDKKIKTEEARIGKNNRRYKESSTSVSSSENKIWLNSFWSLFLIAGTATVFAICIFVVVLVYKHGELVLPQEEDSQWKPSFWRRSRDLFRTFDTKDLKCRTIRDDRVCGNVHLANVNVLSPSTYSVRLEFPADSPETPTLMMESLWMQPEDLLR
ncbi:unnamed protein product [Linum trigynum]|uniref:Uncharacterized protein n=1 Tax=Linum trigynum TaxID=586398 RepID=A0AAV2EGY0_9ROSI